MCKIIFFAGYANAPIISTVPINDTVSPVFAHLLAILVVYAIVSTKSSSLIIRNLEYHKSVCNYRISLFSERTSLCHSKKILIIQIVGM